MGAAQEGLEVTTVAAVLNTQRNRPGSKGAGGQVEGSILRGRLVCYGGWVSFTLPVRNSAVSKLEVWVPVLVAAASRCGFVIDFYVTICRLCIIGSNFGTLILVGSGYRQVVYQDLCYLHYDLKVLGLSKFGLIPVLTWWNCYVMVCRKEIA